MAEQKFKVGDRVQPKDEPGRIGAVAAVQQNGESFVYKVRFEPPIGTIHADFIQHQLEPVD